ncbi:hypothetical protein [Cupriavidus pampae]|uniref:Uncharacterized protein n=1 Tax=Cupriavidus pampae TaxID=659251 RepID=A0ABM8XQT9_9BURK|nr:hypothetical protein [Cupriavidus pampae]CAG9182679.1 hypothetical protein LMG32289_05163 [Cupriavidus pampae]
MTDRAEPTTEAYRGLLLRMHVFQAARGATALKRTDWDYDVAIMDSDGALLSGPFYSSSGYGTQGDAQDACARRGRIVVDVLLADA